MMTKKHFKKIAEILKGNLYKSDGEYRGELFDDFVKWFKKENPKFDEQKFRKAVYN